MQEGIDGNIVFTDFICLVGTNFLFSLYWSAHRLLKLDKLNETLGVCGDTNIMYGVCMHQYKLWCYVHTNKLLHFSHNYKTI